MPVFELEQSFAISVLALSFLSGMGSFLHGKRVSRLNGGFMDLITEITLAIVVGLVVAYMCESEEVDRNITCALVLILSNNGADSLAFLRQSASDGLTRLFNIGGQGK